MKEIVLLLTFFFFFVYPGSASGKEPDCQCRRCKMWVWSLGKANPLKEGITTNTSILAWRIPMERGAWGASVRRVPKSQTWLKWPSTAQHFFLAALGLCCWLQVFSGSYKLLFSCGVSLWWLLLLQSIGSRCRDSVVVAYRLSCSEYVESSDTRDQIGVSCIAWQILNHWTIGEVPI